MTRYCYVVEALSSWHECTYQIVILVHWCIAGTHTFITMLLAYCCTLDIILVVSCTLFCDSTPLFLMRHQILYISIVNLISLPTEYLSNHSNWFIDTLPNHLGLLFFGIPRTLSYLTFPYLPGTLYSLFFPWGSLLKKSFTSCWLVWWSVI